MGAYHGPEGFKTLSHAKGVFKQGGFNFADLFRPPFGKVFDLLLNHASLNSPLGYGRRLNEP